MDTYKNTIDAFFDGWEVHCNIDSFWETNCHINSFDTFIQLLNTYPLQYVKYAEQKLVEKDATGRWCYWFACTVTGANVPLLQQAVIEKDPTGGYLVEWIQSRDSMALPDIVQALVEQNKPVPPLLAEQYPESLGDGVPFDFSEVEGEESEGAA